MEYLILLAALGLFLIIVFVREFFAARKRTEQFVRSLYDGFGKLPEKKYAPERFARVGGYYNRHRSEKLLDDITWNDLNMDEVFRRMDYTLSATGEEYLYYMLRNVWAEQAALAHLEEMTAWFAEHADERVQVQSQMNSLGHTGKFSLYDYIDHLDNLGERSNRKHHMLNLLFLPLIVFAPVRLPLALLGIAVLCVVQIIGYFKEKGEIEPYVISFSYMIRLMETCRKLCQLSLPACAAEQENMRRALHELRGVKGGSFWVFSSGQSRETGNPLDILMDYIRMVFHVDIIIFNKMLAQLRMHIEQIDELVTQAGRIEAAISVGLFRASLADGWCVPELWDESSTLFCMKAGYHPLLAEPVKNSISTDRGVLLTGSNASGKSTFLKTAALNAILAQTIHTCTADAYAAPYFQIYSSMSLRDDLSSGESYYIVEIKALKRVLDAAQKVAAEAGQRAERPVLCFVDEVLRGTNTVERIAASTQIMKSLGGRGILCFAATHDIELTHLLADDYANYHFEEEIRDGDLLFSYQLMEGRAATRNAIKLLEIMGYEPEIVGCAEQMAQDFVRTGVWRA